MIRMCPRLRKSRRPLLQALHVLRWRKDKMLLLGRLPPLTGTGDGERDAHQEACLSGTWTHLQSARAGGTQYRLSGMAMRDNASQ